MVEFYDHPITGRLMMRGPAGGHGGGVTSTNVNLTAGLVISE